MTEHRPRPGRRHGASAFVAGVRNRARAALLLSAAMRSLAIVLCVVFGLALADFAFRLPRGVRLLHLALMAVGGFELFRRVVLPAIRFRPSLGAVALRIEGSERGREASGRLASGIELEGSGDQSSLTGALSRRVSREADEKAGSLRGARFIRAERLWRPAAALGLAAATVGGTALVAPQLAGIALAREFLPLSRVEWPKRTMVVDATSAAVHPIGESLPLRALVARTNQPVGRTDVAARYRVITPSGVGPVERVMLTSQERVAEAGGARGELFERLIEPETGAETEGEIEVWFETEDDRTEPRRIRLTARPGVERITARILPPAYAAEIKGAFVAGEGIESSGDAQGVASIGPILAGSRVQIDLALTKPARRVGGESDGWSRADERTLRFETIALERTRASIELVDDAGLQSADTLTLALDVLEDAPASVAILQPPYDESVLATAVVDVVAEARDDLGMRRLEIDRQIARAPGSSEGAPVEGLGEPSLIASAEAPSGAVEPELSARASMDLAVIGVRAGDEVWLSALGLDLYSEAPEGEGETRSVRSSVRRLRIIDEAVLIEQIRGELAGVRKAAIEIDREQRAIAEQRPVTPDGAERQGTVTERLDAQRRTVERLTERISRNGLDDDSLSGMMDDSAGLVREAMRASAEATEELERSGDEAAEPTEAAREAQERVRESLASLISMLDQGQDSWVARRSIESLLREQRALEADTAALGERTMGRAVEQLSQEDRTELERIAARQRDAADRASQALEGLSERSDMLKGIDPGQAQAMSEAAQRGRQERLAEEMRQAAAQIGENQTRAASQGQQAAAEALEQMLEDMDQVDAARDQALRRVLANVIESLRVLIADQEAQIELLTVAGGGRPLPELSEGMITLAQNTLGLLDELGPQRDLATVTALVDRAAQAQQRAVVSLRASSADSAAEAEDESLSLLREARAEAERLEAEAGARETARQRSELRNAYRQLLEQQVALADATAPLAGAELDRRARAEVRSLGQRQDAIGRGLAEIRRSTDALADAAVFELAHGRMDTASASAAEMLLAGSADATVLRRQETVVRLLRALIDALAEQKQDNAFRDQQSGGGGGGGGGGQGDTPVIPDLAELKLLRAMQAEAMEWTRNVDEAGTRPDEGELSELATLQRELAERGAALVEKLTQQGGPPPQQPQNGPQEDPQ